MRHLLEIIGGARIASALALAGIAWAPGMAPATVPEMAPVTVPSTAIVGPESGTAPASMAAAHRLVACAPGYPGSTANAEPTMTLLAKRLAAAAAWPEGRLVAEYQPTEATGVERIRAADTSLALVPLPFLLAHEQELGLTPIVQTVQADARSTERWSLVAAPGRIDAAEDLDGWEVIGVPAYAPAFVRGPVLGTWGTVPDSATLVFSGRVLGALRRVARGETVATILDQQQVAALASLPDPGAYEVVFTSPPLTTAVVAVVNGRLTSEEVAALRSAFLSVAYNSTDNANDGELLATLRLQGFEAVDTDALTRSRAAFAAAR